MGRDGIFVGAPSSQRRPRMQQRFIRQRNRALWNVRGGASLHCSPVVPLGVGWAHIKRWWENVQRCCAIIHNGIRTGSGYLYCRTQWTVAAMKVSVTRLSFPFSAGPLPGLAELLPLVCIMFVCCGGYSIGAAVAPRNRSAYSGLDFPSFPLLSFSFILFSGLKPWAVTATIVSCWVQSSILMKCWTSSVHFNRRLGQ